MDVYKKMYFKLFNAITDSLELKEKEIADELLKKAQIETEEIYISSGE